MVIELNIQGSNRVCDVHLYPYDNLLVGGLQLEPFDVITCDGPYGILDPPCEWDDFDLNTRHGRKKYKQYYRNLFDAALKHMKPSGSLFVFNYPEGCNIIKSLLDDEYPVYFRRWISWVYENHFDFDSGTNFRRQHETILYYTKESSGFVFNKGDFTDVLPQSILKIEENIFKDGAKPISVIEYLLSATGRAGGRLLSLFGGSGTDIVVAAKFDMDSVAFEFSSIHREIIRNRIGVNYDSVSR
jgi:DNA modification methylase